MGSSIRTESLLPRDSFHPKIKNRIIVLITISYKIKLNSHKIKFSSINLVVSELNGIHSEIT